MNSVCGDSSFNMRMLMRMKVYRQETEFSCGAAVLRSLFDYYEILRDRSEAEICKTLETRFENPHPGTHPDKMIKCLEENGLSVESGENADINLICHYIDQNIPVIVLDSSWGGHWRMVIGYGRHNLFPLSGVRDIYIADPEPETTSQKSLDHEGVVVENEQQFCSKWFERSLYERARNRYYIVGYPNDRNIALYGEPQGKK